MKIISLSILLVYSAIVCKAQMGQWLPGGIDLHEHGSDHFDGKWKLVFQDEFNTGSYPDPVKWEVTDGGIDHNGHTVSVFKASNVSVHNGACELKLTKEDAIYQGQTYKYRAGEINTASPWDHPPDNTWERGMFEARIKMSGAYWAHNNFWLFGAAELNVAECLAMDPKEVPCSIIGRWYNPSGEHCDFKGPVPFKTYNSYHVYTAIWDKYFIYFYVDHSLRARMSRFNASTTNDDSKGLNDNYSFNSYITQPAYYWNKKCFMPINDGLEMILHVFLEEEHKTDWSNFWQIRRNIIKQDKDLEKSMYIDWVRIYQRDECDEDDVITNPILLPYANLSDRHIVLGTQSSNQWANIIPFWNIGTYKAESITMLPNFISSPAINTRGFNTTFLYEARKCPETVNEYIPIEDWETIMPEDTLDEPFDCGDLDSSYIDSVIYVATVSEDTVTLSQIYNLLDSLGCPWANNISALRGSNTKRILTENQFSLSYIKVFPNPNNGSFTVLLPDIGEYDIIVKDIVGVEVYKSTLKNERTKEVQLDAKLPPGNYVVYIKSKDLQHTQRISVVR